VRAMNYKWGADAGSRHYHYLINASAGRYAAIGATAAEGERTIYFQQA
jgi:hypothetical protein